MPAQIRIPHTLRRFTGHEEVVDVSAADVRAAIDELGLRFNGIRERLLDERGQVRGSVLVFVNNEDIRFLQNLATPLNAGDEVSIIPAFAGG